MWLSIRCHGRTQEQHLTHFSGRHLKQKSTERQICCKDKNRYVKGFVKRKAFCKYTTIFFILKSRRMKANTLTLSPQLMAVNQSLLWVKMGDEVLSEIHDIFKELQTHQRSEAGAWIPAGQD